jgi:hypothetical protein
MGRAENPDRTVLLNRNRRTHRVMDLSGRIFKKDCRPRGIAIERRFRKELMSQMNGDKARFNRNRKRRIDQRKRTRELKGLEPKKLS